MPTVQIVRGSYLPIASTYSKGLKDLVDMTLRTDPKRRPTVNEVLKTPVLQERIAKFLSATVRSASRNEATTKLAAAATHAHVMMCVLLKGCKIYCTKRGSACIYGALTLKLAAMSKCFFMSGSNT